MRINEILGKLNELRAVFVLGQRAVPFLEEVFSFLREISPLMDEINSSLRDSTGKMPHARSQLESVTQATELATTEIMDLIDVIQGTIRCTKSNILDSQETVEALRREDASLIRLLRKELTQEQASLLGKIEYMHEIKKEHRRKLDHAMRDQVRTLDEIRESLNQIMMSLQVQDITTQQIAAVNHLIEGIRDRMNTLTQRLGDNSYPEPDVSNPFSSPQRVTFDPNARYDRSGARQVSADHLISSFHPVPATTPASPKPDAGPASQDDIDQLFGGDTAPPEPSKPASPDDIDQLFSSGDTVPSEEPSQPASQDDIDQLFGG